MVFTSKEGGIRTDRDFLAVTADFSTHSTLGLNLHPSTFLGTTYLELVRRYFSNTNSSLGTEKRRKKNLVPGLEKASFVQMERYDFVGGLASVYAFRMGADS